MLEIPWNGVKMLLEIPWEGSKKMRFFNRGSADINWNSPFVVLYTIFARIWQLSCIATLIQSATRIL